MRVALYSRVSTVGKNQDPENQAAQMRAWAAANGHEVVAEYSDMASGSKSNRPEFKQMLDDAADGRFDMLLFWALDRLSREGVLKTLQYLERLDAAGACWRSHTEAYLDSCGVFRDAVLAILAAVARQERLRVSERVKAGLEQARNAGRYAGRPREISQKTVDDMVALRKSGKTTRELAYLYKISKGSVIKYTRGI